MGYKEVVLADSPVSYWRMDDTGSTAADSSSGGNTGTLTGTVTVSQAGVLRNDSDTSMYFNGVDGHLLVAANANLAFTTAFSIEVWVWPATGVGGNCAFFEKTIGGVINTSYTLMVAGGKAYFSIQSAGYHDLVSPNSLLPAGLDMWHHIVGTYDGTNMNLYVDGVLDAGPFASPNPAAGSGIAYIGRSAGSGYYVKGYLDEVAAYSTALSAAQVLAHYSTARTAIPPRRLLQQGLQRASYY